MKTDLQIMINDCNTELADIDNRISSMSPLDKGKVYLTQYALIRACGTIEYVYRSIVADFFSQFNIPQIETYLDKNIRSGSMSADYDNIRKLLKTFDPQWDSSFNNSVQLHYDGQRMISSIKSLVNNRHLFAHGRPPTATFNDIKQYYSDAVTLIQLLDQAVR